MICMSNPASVEADATLIQYWKSIGDIIQLSLSIRHQLGLFQKSASNNLSIACMTCSITLIPCFHRANFLELKIFYRDLNYETIFEVPSYEVR